MTSIAYRNAASSTGSDSVTIGVPSGTANGDILIASIAFGGNTEPSAPSGWTKISWLNLPSGAGAHNLATYWKRAASESGSYTWTIGGGGGVAMAGGVAAYSGCIASGDPIHVHQGQIANATSVTPQVTTTIANTMLVASTAARGTSSAPTYGNPTGFNTTFFTSTGAVAVGGPYKAQAGTGVVSATTNWSGGGGIAGASMELIALLPLPAPTVSAVSPNFDNIAGGRTVTITGTNFAVGGTGTGTGTTVTLKGVSATGVNVINDTTITCVVGAGTAGVGNVVVTTASPNSGTLTNGFTYADVLDNVVKLVKGGVVSGNNKGTAAKWPNASGQVSYGASNDLWGVALTPADVNAGNFGVVLSATVNGGLAKVDLVTMTVYYTVPGQSDPSSLLIALNIDNTRTISQPEVYKLPRNNLAVVNDLNIDRAGDQSRLNTSRYYQPSRNHQKTWRDYEFFLDEGANPPANATPLQVWAAIDDGTPTAQLFQLLDSTGAAASLRGTGRKQVFFPPATSVGSWVQLQFVVPATGVGEQMVAYAMRDGVLHGVLDPLTADKMYITLILGDGEYEDRTSMRRTIRKQIRDLKAISGRNATPVAYKDINGDTGYLKIEKLRIREVVFKEFEWPVSVAIIEARELPYA